MSEYLNQEQEHPRRPTGFANSIFRTWKVSFKRIEEQEPTTTESLSFISLLASQQIPLRLLLNSRTSEAETARALGTLFWVLSCVQT